MDITFTGEWNRQDKAIILADLAPVRENNPNDTIECQYSPSGVPFRAIVRQRGRVQKPVAYSAEALAENIRNCF